MNKNKNKMLHQSLNIKTFHYYAVKIQALIRSYLVRRRMSLVKYEFNMIDNHINNQMKLLKSKRNMINMKKEKENQIIYKNKLNLLYKEAAWLKQTIHELESDINI